MTTFKLDPNVDVSMTAFHDTVIRTSLPSLVRKLGPAHVEREGDKVQFEWRFSDDRGRPVALYDWKSPSAAPGVWHVGARDPRLVEEFMEWWRSA